MAAVSSVPFVFADQDLPQSKAQEYWQSLEHAISEIQAGRASNLMYEELYRKGYMLTLHRHGDMLYEGVSGCIRKRLKDTTAEVASSSREELLEKIVGEWRHHKLVMSMIRDILMYMNNSYCKTKKVPTVYELGIYAFREDVISNHSVANRLSEILLNQVERERKGEAIPRLLMKDALSMLAEVSVERTHNVYNDLFEAPFLQQTRVFYNAEMQSFIVSHRIPDFLKRVEARLLEEESRADGYLDKSTKPKLRTVLQQELIVAYSERVVTDNASGCTVMFRDNSVKDLERCYLLFSREPKAMDDLRVAMGKLVTSLGVEIVQDPDNLRNPTQFVQKVLDIREKFSNVVQTAFKSDRTFSRTLKESVEHFINLDARAAQYLSLYMDEMFRKQIKGMSAQAVEDRLSNVISIFRYLQEKDVFEDFYKKQLAARLLTSQSIDQEAEKKMIAELKAECGHQYTSRLEGMFKDMKLSKELMTKFINSHPRRDLSLSVTVLTTGFWPIPVVPKCKLPATASRAAQDFLHFYTGLHNGRRLSWQTNLGSAELRVQFEKGVKELLVHTYQMCIMMLFNSGDSLTYKHIQEQTNIPADELERHLLSLAHPKVRLLKKNPNNKSLGPDHTFTFNLQYTSKLRRVKIPLLTAKPPVEPEKQEDSEVPESVMELRKHRVEAAIVRIMKARKTLEHNNLVGEVLRQLQPRFAVEPAFIKKRIEGLIEREYIKRDEENRKLYRYI
eukprot:gb/GEZN01002613.1/.p1 GENE.gb/GEZN01002613.1/~~gb/GEZN01002613.1/.p1  ORF type:complete len:731 (-),score=119.65 gb/GEZN01002613.1/:115-2307(-)